VPKLRRWLIATLVWLAAAACAGGACAADKNLVTLNFVNADIEGVVKAVSEITGKNFVIDPRVRGTVNIISGKPIPRSRVYDVFLAALRVQGFVAIEDGGIVRIVPAADAKVFNSPTFGPQQAPHAAGDRIQTRIFKLKYEPAAQALATLRPLISPGNSITASTGSNSLVVTDYASNLQRIARIIEVIDQPAGTGPIVIPLRYASALDVAQTVNRLFKAPQEQNRAPGAQGSTQGMTVVADARSNSLLASSDNPAELSRLRNLVAIIDTPTSAAGNIHVVYLQNAQAVEVAKTLRAIYAGNTQVTSEATGQQSASGAGAPPPGPQGGAMTVSSPPGAPNLMGGGGQIGFTPFENTTGGATAPGIIQADPNTNSLIIDAPDAIYNNLRAVIQKLDVRRKEVYVQALIAEITSDRAAEFGIQWQDLNGVNSNQASAVGGTNFGIAGQNILSISQNPTSAANGLNIGIIKGTVTIPGVSGQVLNLEVLVRALDTDANANILSTPTLLTLDNQEANIVVGQNIPIITGQYALSGTATSPTPFQTIEREDVGLTLRIKPQITEGGIVRLQLYAEVSSIQNQNNPSGIITNKRSVQSVVQVNDGQIIVIGGLIQDAVTNTAQKVPLLGDLPVLGGLFRYDTREHTKTNLMVFLQPTIVAEAQNAEAMTNENYSYAVRQQEKSAPPPNPMLPQMQPPVLPPREQKSGPPPPLIPETPPPGAPRSGAAPPDALMSEQNWW
jgi:general secretion pathway protein D